MWVRDRRILTSAAMVAVALTVGEARQQPASDAEKSSALATQYLNEANALRAKSDATSLQQSLEKYAAALALARATKSTNVEGAALNGIGRIHDSRGDYKEALDAYNELLALARTSSDRQMQAIATGNLGRVLLAGGETQQALDHFRTALAAFEALGDRVRQSTALHALGSVYHTLGDPRRAIVFYEQALTLLRAQPNRLAMAPTLNTLALVHSQINEHRRALSLLEEALAIAKEAGDKRLIAYAIHNQGDVARAMGNFAQALGYQKQALPLRRAVNDREGETRVLIEIGANLTSLGNHTEARVALREALSLAGDLQDRAGQALAHSGLARAERAAGDIESARRHIESALGVVESLRTATAGHELRTSYLAASHTQYELYIDLLMTLHRANAGGGFDRLALEASERSRARSLIDLLAEARVDIRQGVEQVLLEREREIRGRLNARAERQIRLMREMTNREEATALAAEIQQLITSLHEIEAQIRVRSPQYAAISTPQPLTWRDIQGLLDRETALLEYALGDERSYVWAVTSDSITAYELPRRQEIERAARDAHRLLSTRQAQPGEMGALSDIVLKPVLRELRQRRLIIVADGALQYIPFAALPRPGGSVRLVGDHEVVSVPSMSALASLRSDAKHRSVPTKAVAVVADPVFDASDERVEGTNQATTATVNAAATSDARLSAESLGIIGPGGRVARLPFTKREAQGILALVPPADRLEAVGFLASRQTVVGDRLRSFRIVHFATHGFLNNEHPDLSGIVLSLVDERGEPQDGFLRLHDLYNLRLPAELVVLSACQTALGEETKGEGLIGLTRGLMYAGARRVVASLWKVDDAATAELMKRFYAGMLGADHLSPAAALRAAQFSMSQQRRWSSPYYWAGFVLEGEWR